MNLISELELENSLRVKISDNSRQIAADRWYVKLTCELRMSVGDEQFARFVEDDTELVSAIRHRMGDEISMEIVKERNFVEHEEKDRVLQELSDRMSENIEGYISSVSFPERFFKVRYEELKKTGAVEMAVPDNEEEWEDPEGRADFSACFRD